MLPDSPSKLEAAGKDTAHSVPRLIEGCEETQGCGSRPLTNAPPYKPQSTTSRHEPPALRRGLLRGSATAFARKQQLQVGAHAFALDGVAALV